MGPKRIIFSAQISHFSQCQVPNVRVKKQDMPEHKKEKYIPDHKKKIWQSILVIRQKCLTNILAHTWESFSYYHHIIFRKRIRHSLQSFHIIQISGGNPSCVWFGIMEYYERIWVSFWSANDFHPLLAQIFSTTFLFVTLFLFST